MGHDDERGLCQRCEKNDRDTVSTWCQDCRKIAAEGGADAELSPAGAVVTKYVIRPTGWDQSPWMDKGRSFELYVEQFPDTGRWRIHDGFYSGGFLMTHTGKLTRDRPQVRRFTRFDTAQEAIDVAVKHVDQVVKTRNRFPLIPATI